MCAHFSKKSKAEFSNCVRCIDGMLVWTHFPNENNCLLAECGAKKFLCSRKKNFGLNMQAVCDARGRFLDIDIHHPGATSDYLSFMTSQLKKMVSTPNFLGPGLALYGDNAYVTCEYMVTPFKCVKQDKHKDAYNFYHSQLRINIECALGQLVQRWSILRKPIPLNISLKKTTALVMCLCKLHNFCIDMADTTVVDNCDADKLEISVGGGVTLERVIDEAGDECVIPTELLHGGDHYDDIVRHLRRKEETNSRDCLLQLVIDEGLQRPRPRQWEN